MDSLDILEIIAVATGLLSIWFNTRVNILVYPIGMVSTLLYIYIFHENQWFANMLINAAYFAISGYGWYNWKHPRTQNKELPVSFLTSKHELLYALGALALFGLICLVNPSESDVSVLDAFTSSLGLTAMILVTQKKIENWIYYLIADAILIPMCIHSGLYLTAVQYTAYCILAVMGFINWRKETRNA